MARADAATGERIAAAVLSFAPPPNYLSVLHEALDQMREQEAIEELIARHAKGSRFFPRRWAGVRLNNLYVERSVSDIAARVRGIVDTPSPFTDADAKHCINEAMAQMRGELWTHPDGGTITITTETTLKPRSGWQRLLRRIFKKGSR